MDGVLIVDKPAGPTSHDVVAVVRRVLGTPRVGHTGTLDPLAMGVLVLVVGKGTRLASFLTGAEKEYIARVRFGAATPTYDAESQVPQQGGPAPPLEAADIGAQLTAFTGTYLQQPPPYSAKKVAGVPAYKLARQQKPVEIKPVEVTVSALELRSYSGGVAELRIVCSSGFYVRSLAHDLGARLGCGAYLESLQRTRVGAFAIENARPLVDIVAGAAAREWIVPMEDLLPDLAAVTLTEQGERRALHGNTLRSLDFAGSAGPSPNDRLRLLDRNGTLVGIAERRDAGLLHPVVILV